jgi:hypothetical protein
MSTLGLICCVVLIIALLGGLGGTYAPWGYGYGYGHGGIGLVGLVLIIVVILLAARLI